MRPLYEAEPASILNPTLFAELAGVLQEEIGSARLEDFEQPPDISAMLDNLPLLSQ